MAANPKHLKQAKVVDLSGDLLSVARVPGTDDIYVGGSDGKIHQLDLAAEKPTPVSWDAHVSFISDLVVAGKYLVSAGSDHRLIWWGRESRPVRSNRIHSHSKWLRCLAVSSDGRTLASGCDDMVCRLWEVETGKLLRELRGHKPLTSYHTASKLYACTFSDDGKYLATADQVGDILVWEQATGKRVLTIEAPNFWTQRPSLEHTAGGIRTLAFSPDGKTIAAGGNIAGNTSVIAGSTALIQVFETEKGQQVHEIKGGDFFYERVAFHHEGDWLLGAGGVGNTGQQLVFFDLAQNAVIHEAPSDQSVFDMVLNETSDVLYTVGRGKGLVQWNLKARPTLRV
jgi:WD40 repeat protein